MFFIPPLPQSALVALRLGRARGPRRAACALRAPQRPKKDRARAARRPLAPTTSPRTSPACHARPKRPAAGGRAHTAPHCAPHLVQHQPPPRRRGPARRARPREVGSRRCGRERRRVPRGRGRVLHTVCPTQRRNERCAGGAGSGAPRRARASRKGRRAAPPAPPPARRAHRARARASHRLANPTFQDLWKVEGTADAYLLRRQFVPRPGMGQRSRENDDAPAPPHARRAHRGPRGRPPCLVDPTFTKSGKVGKGS